MTGLVIGSLTPDFEYFIRMKVKSIYSHTLLGTFWFDLPLAIILAFIFHNFVRQSLFLNLPTIIQRRLYPFIQFNWNYYFKKNWLIVIVSSMIGILSNLFWDAFTHNHGYFVNQFPELNAIIILFGSKFPLWKIMQHLSTFIGAIIIIMALFKLPKNSIQKTSINKKYWVTIFSIVILILILRLSLSFNIQAFGNIIVSMISAFLISLILTPLIIKPKVNQKN